MRARITFLLVPILALAPLATVLAAQRTFVASYGNDATACTLAQPCRGFQKAIDAVDASGEVVALDSAGYGAMAIHKSVSVIVPPGIHAGLSPSTGIPVPGYPGYTTVVLIDIAPADVVVLRGLHISHQGTVTGGIDWVSGGTVQIDGAVVSGFPSEGLFVQASDVTGQTRLQIKDSIFRQNPVGVWLRGTHPFHVVIDHVHIEGSAQAGMLSEGPGIIAVRESLFTLNLHGIEVKAPETGHVGADYVLENCLVSQNSVAFFFDVDGGDSSISVAGSSIHGNAVGSSGTHVRLGGGGGDNRVVVSRGNNSVLGNHGAGPFDTTFPPQ